MKITAQIQRGDKYNKGRNSVFQMEVTATELMHLIGYKDYGNEQKARDHTGRFKKRETRVCDGEIFAIGDEIDVSKMFDSIVSTKRQAKEVLEYSAKLKAAAALLDALPDVIESAHYGPNPIKLEEASE